MAGAGGRRADIHQVPFGTTQAGEPVILTTLDSGAGVVVRFLSYGGVIAAIEAPDRTGAAANIVLGFDTLAEYEAKGKTIYFGALVGRYANRIGGARFTLDGQEFRLTANEGRNCLHGGARGLDKQVWRVEPRREGEAVGAVLSCTSPDGTDGFPGTLTVEVTYTLAPDNSLTLDYRARTDRPTVVNLTNHSYFNLAGNGAGSIAGHLIEIAADHFTPVDEASIPTGEIAPVAGTPLDFRHPMPMGARLRSPHPQMLRARGHDHNYVLNRSPAALGLAARVHEPRGGRVLEVLTTQPGVQFYTGNFLDGTVAGSSGTTYRQSDAFALETQHFPDSPNQPDFPSTTLRPGEEFTSRTVYRFLTDR